jgi:hypothetical protein
MVGRREQVAGKQNRPCFFEDHCNLTARTHDDRKALKRFDRIVCGGWHVMPTLVLSSPVPIGDAHQKRIAMMSAPQQMFDTEHMMAVGESKNNRLIRTPIRVRSVRSHQLSSSYDPVVSALLTDL